LSFSAFPVLEKADVAADLAEPYRMTQSGGRRSKLSALRDASLLDHFVGGRQQRFRDGKAECLGGLEF
jgi:hypothetical protein